MTVVVSIQARMGSTRLPGKVLLPLGERRVLGWVHERCRLATAVDAVVVAIGDRPADAAIVQWCRRRGHAHVVGPENDLLARHLEVVSQTNCDVLVQVTGDCPFLPTGEIDRTVLSHAKHSEPYTTGHGSGMPIGSFVDVVDRSAIEDLARKGESHPVTPLRSKQDGGYVQLDALDCWDGLGDVHLAVDTPVDYWIFTDAIDEVGPEPLAVAQWLQKQASLQTNPRQRTKSNHRRTFAKIGIDWVLEDPVIVGVFLEEILIPELVSDLPELLSGNAEKIYEVIQSRLVKLSVMFHYDSLRFFPVYESVPDPSAGDVSRPSEPELRVLHPKVDDICN
jgi:spore coat polysaccharide biosynthesis protein SpsF